MKLTKTQLKQIIQEELESIISEGPASMMESYADPELADEIPDYHSIDPEDWERLVSGIEAEMGLSRERAEKFMQRLGYTDVQQRHQKDRGERVLTRFQNPTRSVGE